MGQCGSNCAWIETVASGGIGYGFVDQQNRNVVPNWINPLACTAFQTLSVLFQSERFLADGTDQDVKQVFGDHGFTYTTFGRARRAPTDEDCAIDFHRTGE